jgi:hypothetical protein
MLWDHLEVGFLDEVFSSFDRYQHTVLLIGEHVVSSEP